MDPKLWKVENYAEFLAARRELLAKAGNQFLDSLLKGGIPDQKPVATILEVQTAPVSIDEDETRLLELNAWVQEQGLPSGLLDFQLTDSSGQVIESLDLAWPNGLQLNLSQPATVLLNHNGASNAAAQTGYRVFTTVEQFKAYVLHEVLSAA
jgi:hypothetical protein